jgi:hypothetical protein
MLVPPELTLIVAATRNMGIGRNGGLPWTGLKKEMAYFARVTKRSCVGETEMKAPATQVRSIPLVWPLLLHWAVVEMRKS